MGNIDRRTFLLVSGRWLLLAGLTPLVSGCGRVLSWSESQGGSPEPYGAISETVSSTSVSVSDAVPPLLLRLPASTRPLRPRPNRRLGPRPIWWSSAAKRPTRTCAPLSRGWGAWSASSGRDAKVVIKPNVLTGRPPEYATTTNPLVVSALIRMCLEAGAAEVTVLDYPTSSPRAAFKESGIAQADRGGGRQAEVSGGPPFRADGDPRRPLPLLPGRS